MKTIKIDNPYFNLYRTKFASLTESNQQQSLSQEKIEILLEQFALVHNCSIQMFYDVTQVISLLYSSIQEKDNYNDQHKMIEINENDKMKEENQAVLSKDIENLDPKLSIQKNPFNFMEFFSYQPQQHQKNNQNQKKQNFFKTKSKNNKNNKFPFQPKKIKLDNIIEESEQTNKSITNNQEIFNQVQQPKNDKSNLNKTKVYKIQFEKDDSQLSQNSAILNQDKEIPLLQQQACDKIWENKDSKNNNNEEQNKLNQEDKPSRQVYKKKSERQVLKGHACTKCEKFYEALGLKDNENQQFCQCVSRHRYDYPLPSTPDIFYNDDTYI